MGYRIGSIILIIFIALNLAHCSNSTNYAPVVDAWNKPAAASNYIVQKGDTLYSISWAFDMDYRDLARINNISAPNYMLRPGQTLNMGRNNKKTGFPAFAKNDNRALHWLRPAQGRISKKFALKSGSKGIDISGKFGEPVMASVAGVVVYSGSGLRGYGNLIIIKHNADYLSAYAHNDHILVKERQTIKAGEKIATMGRANDGKIVLHFEIRHNGKPVDPLRYLG
jgi:lipoprotein NlpD